MKNTSKFQNVVIATIVGWLVLFVFTQPDDHCDQLLNP